MLLENGHEVNVRSEGEATPLWLAARFNATDVAMLLLSKKDIDVNHAPQHGETTLQLATDHCNLEIVTGLLAHEELDVNFFGKLSRPAIASAALNGDEDMIQLLLKDSRLDVNLVDREGSTALNSATRMLHVGSVKAILANPNVNPNCRDRGGKTPLMQAASPVNLTRLKEDEKRRAEIVASLLSRSDIDVNLRNYGRSTLWIAALDGRYDIVELLLAHPDIDLAVKDVEGRTILAELEHLIVQNLIPFGSIRHEILLVAKLLRAAFEARTMQNVGYINSCMTKRINKIKNRSSCTF